MSSGPWKRKRETAPDAATPEERRQVAECIAKSCGWEGAEEMRRTIRDEIPPANLYARIGWGLERATRRAMWNQFINGECAA